MAEGFLRHRLVQRGVDARVHSAGLVAPGQPAADHGVDLLRAQGIDISAHRSRRVTTWLLDEADLVIGMAREHVREAVVLRPEAWPRTYTLKELVRRGTAHGPRRPGQSLDDWLGAVGEGREPKDLFSSPDDDIADPIGRPRAVYERCAAEIASLVDRLADLLVPAGSASGDRARE